MDTSVDGRGWGPQRVVDPGEGSCQPRLLTHSYETVTATHVSDCSQQLALLAEDGQQQKVGGHKNTMHTQPGKYLQHHTPSRMCILTSSDLSGRERIFRFK